MRAQNPPRRMLLISFSYAPMLNARAFRWTALAEHFASTGWEIDVVTSRQPGMAPGEAQGALRIHRAGWRWAEALRGLLRRQRGQVPESSGNKRGFAGLLLQMLRERVWRHLYWPDSSCLWYWPARRAALRLVEAHEHDVIVSVSPGFTAVLVGKAARRAQPRARWVIDVGDPFSLQVDAAPNNATLYGTLNRRAERDAFARADAIAVTTAQTAARYADAFPESSAKVRVIPPLLSIGPASSDARVFDEEGVVRFVYVGTLYRGLREPGFLLELFGALCARRPAARHELHFFGDVHQFADLLRASQERLPVKLHGTVPRETIARAVEGASVLVNIGNSSSDQLPSKVVEYAASGKPILNIARNAADTSAAFLGSYPDKLTLYDAGRQPAPEQIEEIEKFSRSLPRRIPAGQLEAWLAPYRLPEIAERYEALLR